MSGTVDAFLAFCAVIAFAMGAIAGSFLYMSDEKGEEASAQGVIVSAVVGGAFTAAIFLCLAL